MANTLKRIYYTPVSVGAIGSQVKITEDDAISGYLNDKLTVESGKLEKTVINPGGIEQLKLDIGADVYDKTVDTSEDVSYNPTISGLLATNVQEAIDELSQSKYNPRPQITLSSTDISNKYVDLVVTPGFPNLSRLSIGGGPDQVYGVDFQVSGTLLTWNGLNLDGILEAGDILIITLK